MRVGVIINPMSGPSGRHSRSGADRAALASRFADRRRELTLETAVTNAPGHAIELARDFAARGFAVVVAWGGDGTANETAGPLIGTSTALGIVAEGSGDGFARGLALPRETDAALAAAVDRPGVPIDVGYANERHFLNVAGIGFDAELARLFNAAGSHRGAIQYVRLGVGLVWSYRSGAYTLTVDGQCSEERLFLIAFANGREYGNGVVLAADADVRDGRLDAVLLEDGPLWRQVWRARRMRLGVGRPAAGIRRAQVRSGRVEGARLMCHVDGESFVAAGAVEIRVAPGALLMAGLAANTGAVEPGLT